MMRSNERSNRRWMILFVAAALLLGVTRRHFSSQSAGLKSSADRKPFPDLILPQLGGGTWRLSDHRGQVVLLNYWATWCEPCRDELPALLQVARESEPKGLVVVGISMDSEPNALAKAQTVQQFVTRFRIPYPIAFPNAIMNAQGIDIGLPTTLLIDKQHRVAKTYIGEVERAVLANDVAALLAESVPPQP